MANINTRSARILFARHGEDMLAEVDGGLNELSARAARMMREKAAKWRTTLTNSIKESAPAPFVREVRPGVAHAEAVERGVKPGGKGLPRYFDPASKSIVDWLLSKVFAGAKRVRKGSGRFTARELELRDRYEGLAWHVRRKGVKAQPYVEPTEREMQPMVLARMGEAVRRAVARSGAGNGGASV